MRTALLAILLVISNASFARPIDLVCSDITRDVLSPEFQGETMKTRKISYDAASKESTVETLLGTRPAKVTSIQKGADLSDPDATVVTIQVPLNARIKDQLISYEEIQVNMTSLQASGFFKWGKDQERISTISRCRKQ